MLAFYENRNESFSITQGERLNFPPHLHKHVEIIYVTEGKVFVNNVYLLQTGDLFIAFPNSVHSYITKETCRFTMLIFDLELAAAYASDLTQYSTNFPYLLKEQVHQDIIYSLNRILLDYSEQKEDMLSKWHIHIMIGRILQCLTLLPNNTQPHVDTTQQVLHYITENFKNPIDLGKISRELGISRFYLSRIFSQNIGCSFNHYINALRITLAKDLIQNNCASIIEIALECGFESQTTFNRAFKSICGITPREYKKLHYNTSLSLKPE